MQSLRTPIPARHTPPLLAANPAPRPLASCKVCVPIIMVLRDYYPKVCENPANLVLSRGEVSPRRVGVRGSGRFLARVTPPLDPPVVEGSHPPAPSGSVCALAELWGSDDRVAARAP